MESSGNGLAPAGHTGEGAANRGGEAVAAGPCSTDHESGRSQAKEEELRKVPEGSPGASVCA